MATRDVPKVNKDDDAIISEKVSKFLESKLFRWISVFLYLGGISGLGMVLSMYYLMFFDSRMPDIHLKFPVSIGGHPVQKLHGIQLQ